MGEWLIAEAEKIGSTHPLPQHTDATSLEPADAKRFAGSSSARSDEVGWPLRTVADYGNVGFFSTCTKPTPTTVAAGIALNATRPPRGRGGRGFFRTTNHTTEIVPMNIKPRRALAKRPGGQS